MKNNKLKKKKEYYIHQIVREEQENFVQNADNENQKINISIYSGIKKVPDYAENVGYRLDPSHYDTLRVSPKIEKKLEDDDKEDEIELEETFISENQEENENNNNYEDEAKSEDDYYANLADQYVENEETVIYDPIDENQIDEEIKEEACPKPEIKSNQNNNPVIKTNQNKETKILNVIPPKKSVKHRKYVQPSLDLLEKGHGTSDKDISLAEMQKEKINELLLTFGIKAHVAKYIFAPTVILHLIELESLKEDVTNIKKIEKNLLMSLASSNIRILTPIPGRSYAGIEIPRPKDNRGMVYLGDLLADKEFKNSQYTLPVVVGINTFGEKKYIDIADMPHGLCAGATKSGKSVCLNTFILSLIFHFSPDDVRIMLLDPKIVEFGKYEDMPHLAMPVITDEEYFEPALIWLKEEMDRRYKILNKYGAVELAELNDELVARHEQKIPYIVMIMDEFNDWFINASATVDECMTKLMQKARAAGIHIILATQRPSADVIRGAIKANITTRLAFRVSSAADSIVIIGQSAAEKLEGRGDVILRYPGMNDMRLQAAFVSNKEIKDVVEFLREKNEVDYIVTLEELKQSSASRGHGNGSNDPKLGRNDEYFKEVCYYVVRNQNASVNQLQKIFGTNFNRMDNIFKDMEVLGIVSGTQPGTKRKVLINEVELEAILENL